MYVKVPCIYPLQFYRVAQSILKFNFKEIELEKCNGIHI